MITKKDNGVVQGRSKNHCGSKYDIDDMMGEPMVKGVTRRGKGQGMTQLHFNGNNHKQPTPEQWVQRRRFAGKTRNDYGGTERIGDNTQQGEM